MLKTCIVCNKEFETLNKNKRICSQDCIDKYNESFAYRICKNCGKRFKRERTPCGDFSQKQICFECEQENKKKVCENCGNKFLPKKKEKYCDICLKQIEHKINYITCNECGVEFKRERLPSGKLSNKSVCNSCSEKLYKKAHFGVCLNCGKEFEYPILKSGYISKQKYCSDICFKEQYNK